LSRETELKALTSKIKLLLNKYSRRKRTNVESQLSAISIEETEDDDYDDDEELDIEEEPTLNSSSNGNKLEAKPRLIAKMPMLPRK
jgi:hypothetical protein